MWSEQERKDKQTENLFSTYYEHENRLENAGRWTKRAGIHTLKEHAYLDGHKMAEESVEWLSLKNWAC